MSLLISAITVTCGRTASLQEAIACFLEQDYADRQHVILNTCPQQTLYAPFAKIINLSERPKSLGEARNIAIEAADGEFILTADDDDLFRSNHFSTYAKHLEDGIDWLWAQKQLYVEGWKGQRITHGTCVTVGFRKSAWKKIGGYPHITVGEDRIFIQKLVARCHGLRMALEDRDVTMLYHWGQGSYIHHTSGLGDDQPGRPSAYDRYWNNLQERIKRGEEPTGEIMLRPGFKVHPETIVSEFFAERDKHRGKPGSVCIVQLGRLGDLINILPLALWINNRYAKPHMMVSREFASLLDGVSYVTPYPVDIPFDQLQPALALAKKEFTHVIQTQIYGKDFQCERQTDAYNKESWRQAGFLHLFDNPALRPVFDRRDKAREALLLSKMSTGKPFLLCQVSGGYSSPLSCGPEILKEIRKQCPEYEVVDLSAMRFERLYDILALMEQPGTVVISADTAIAHLVTAATPTPRTILLKNPVDWLGTFPRHACTVRTYTDAVQNFDKIAKLCLA